jgi:DNA modification methylase
MTLIWNKAITSLVGLIIIGSMSLACMDGKMVLPIFGLQIENKLQLSTLCKKSKSDLHPTMKPVELIEYQVLNNTKGQDIVLDLFGGSGSTLIASEKIGRHSRLWNLTQSTVM